MRRECRGCGGDLRGIYPDDCCTCETLKHEPDCVLAGRGHEGPCVDDPPHLYDPRPDPREFPDYWTE